MTIFKKFKKCYSEKVSGNIDLFKERFIMQRSIYRIENNDSAIPYEFFTQT